MLKIRAFDFHSNSLTKLTKLISLTWILIIKLYLYVLYAQDFFFISVHIRVMATVISVPDKCNVNLLRSPQKSLSPLKSPNKDKENLPGQQNKSKIKSPLGQKNQWPDAGAAEYKVRLAKSKIGDFITVKGKTIR